MVLSRAAQVSQASAPFRKDSGKESSPHDGTPNLKHAKVRPLLFFLV